MSRALVELTLRMGPCGERVKTVALPIDDRLARDLTEPLELSDEPWSLMLASPCLYGGRGDAVTVRRRAFALRRETAREIGRAVAEKLVEMFGAEDEVDGYKKRDLTEDELRRRGLPVEPAP
jgi:hypothetical protein